LQVSAAKEADTRLQKEAREAIERIRRAQQENSR